MSMSNTETGRLQMKLLIFPGASAAAIISFVATGGVGGTDAGGVLQ